MQQSPSHISDNILSTVEASNSVQWLLNKPEMVLFVNIINHVTLICNYYYKVSSEVRNIIIDAFSFSPTSWFSYRDRINSLRQYSSVNWNGSLTFIRYSNGSTSSTTNQLFIPSFVFCLWIINPERRRILENIQYLLDSLFFLF